MRLFALALACVLLFSNSNTFPQTPSAAPAVVQPATLLQQSLAVLVGVNAVSDITLTGTAHRIAGSEDEIGTVTYRALSIGASRYDFSYPSGSRSEARAFSNGRPVGAWTGPDAVTHPVPYHNLLAADGTSPALLLTNLAASPNVIITLVGVEQKNGQSVFHLIETQLFSSLSDASLPQHLSQMDIFLDTASLFPVALGYSIHPDSNALLDIPVELLFSDYRTVSGIKIPFHIQKSINGSLALDFQFDAAIINSGISASVFIIQ